MTKNVSMADMDLDILRMQPSTNSAVFLIIVQNGRGGEGVLRCIPDCRFARNCNVEGNQPRRKKHDQALMVCLAMINKTDLNKILHYDTKTT